jgi:hypothetical protein
MRPGVFMDVREMRRLAPGLAVREPGLLPVSKGTSNSSGSRPTTALGS